MKLLNNHIVILFFLGLLTGPVSATTIAIPGHPVGRVSDYAHLFSAKALGQMNEMMGSYEATTGKEIIIATFPSMGGGNLAGFATALYNQWKIGQKNQQRGILVIIFKKERLIKIEVGPGLQKHLSQERCSEVIRQSILPNFKKGDYDHGMIEAIAVLTNILEERESGVVSREKLSTRASLILAALLLAIGILVLMLILRFRSANNY